MKYLLLCLLLIAGCNKKTPEIEIKAFPADPIVIVPPTSVETPTPPIADLTAITKLAEGSTCANYSWPQRGRAPLGYIKGMARGYARELCFPSAVVSSTKLGTSDKDVLTHYGLTPTSRNLYNIMIGAGMRESSGKYCEGKDASASNTSSTTAEAGMFQTSYNAFSSSPELGVLFKEYKDNKHNCLDVFKDPKINCTAAMLKNYGTGDGLKYQEMAKSCPAFAVQVKAITSRVLYRHYGPLINKAAEARPECGELLIKVEEVVKSTPGLCDQLK
jgi:hypothetical protein